MERQLNLIPSARPLLERFGREFFRDVPEKPGVYLMCGAEAGVLYVGKAKNLRQRLFQYRSANLYEAPRKLRRLLSAVERIEWDECTDEAAALARERELLRALQPRFNRVGVRAPRLDWIGWRPTADGLAMACGELGEEWESTRAPMVMGRWLHGAALRLVWWMQNPLRGWEEMPRPLQAGKSPAVWEFKMDMDQAAEVRRCLVEFFHGESPELVEWCVGVAAVRPAFERAWVEQDALWLLDGFERLQSDETSLPPTLAESESPLPVA